MSFSFFEQSFRSETIDGSKIDPVFIDKAIKFASNEEVAKALRWKGCGRKEIHAALFVNEDGSVWHSKLSQPMTGGKRYCAPAKNENRAYFPPVPQEIRDRIAARYEVEIPVDGSFWDWMKKHPEIPISVTEGGKKALCLLSQGYVAIAVYGCRCGNSPDLEPYLNEGREITISYDRDTKQKAIDDVIQGTLTLGDRSVKSGAITRVTMWDPKLGKGLDDFIANCGGEAWEKVYANAESFREWKIVNQPKQQVWDCLPAINHQIGDWSKPIEIDDASKVQEWLDRAKVDRNIKHAGTKVVPNGSTVVEVHGFSVFKPKADFDFEVVKILASDDGGGLVLKVSRIEGGRVIRREAFIRSIEISKVSDFVNAVKREIGQNVACTLKPEELQSLIQNRTAHYRLNGGKTYKLADRTGQQDDGTWVFENAQFKSDGTQTTEAESLWIFNQQLGETEKIPSPKIAAQNPDALPNLAKACKNFFHPKTLPLVWFTCGYIVSTFQRKEIMAREGNFPQLSLFGDPGGAKTTAAMVAVSLAGMHQKHCIITKFSESLIYEQVKSLGGLPLLLDDPIKKGKRQADSRDQLDNFVWSAYNGATRKVRLNEQTPHTNVIVTSNISLGEGSQAVESRLIKLHYRVRTQNDAGFPALEESMDDASAGISRLLAVRYDRSAVKDIRSRLLEHLSGAHSRISSSYALLVYFTQKFCDIAGIDFDAFDYCIKHLCPTANDLESDKDSLTDFLEKLAQMRAEGLVGDWNCTQIKSQHKSYLAVVLADIWGDFERRYSPNYSRQSIEQIILGRGGKKNSPQKFVATKLECLEFDRAMAASKRGQEDISVPMRPSKGILKKAILIPGSELPLSDLIENDAIEAFSTYESQILEDDPETIEDLKVAETETLKTQHKEDHPNYIRIAELVREANLTTEESQEIRQNIFGDRWKQWRKYTEADMAQFQVGIQHYLATRKLVTKAANADGEWR